MTQDNSLTELDSQSYQTKKQSASFHFEDELEKLPKPNQQNIKHKYRCAMLTEKDCNNSAAWQINSQKKL